MYFLSLYIETDGDSFVYDHIPGAKMIYCCLYLALRLVSWIHASVHHMRLAQRACQEIVNMQRKVMEASFWAHEAMDVYQ